MKKAVLLMMIFLLSGMVWATFGLAQSSAGGAEGEGVPAVYQPGKVYAGTYESDRLYYRYPKSFWRYNAHPALFVREITCYQARVALERFGFWTGALNRDGSCADGDPRLWASGNYINFTVTPKVQ